MPKIGGWNKPMLSEFDEPIQTQVTQGGPLVPFTFGLCAIGALNSPLKDDNPVRKDTRARVGSLIIESQRRRKPVTIMTEDLSELLTAIKEVQTPFLMQQFLCHVDEDKRRKTEQDVNSAFDDSDPVEDGEGA